MNILSILIYAGGISLIIMTLFSKKKRSSEKKISLISMLVLTIIAGILSDLSHVKPFSTSFERIAVIRMVSHISLGMALGIILTLRIFGEIKFRKIKSPKIT
jgi:hypothetical protein